MPAELPVTSTERDTKGGRPTGAAAALSVAAESPGFRNPNRTERRLAHILAGQVPPSAPLLARIRIYPARRRLMSFNDCVRTTHEDVLAVYDRTIHRLATRVPEYALR